MDQRPWTLGPVHPGELVIGVIAVALHEVPAIAFEEAERMHGAPTGCVVEHHDRRTDAAMTPVIGDDGPEVAGLGLSSPGVALPLIWLCLNLCGGTVAFSPATILDRLDRTWRV